MDRSEYRRAVRDFLNRSRTALAKQEPPAHRQEIAPNDIPSIKGQIRHAVDQLEKLGNCRELCAQGCELLTLLCLQPDLRGDEDAMHAYLGFCAEKLSVMENASAAFTEAMQQYAADRLLGGDGSRKNLGKEVATLLGPQFLSGLFAPNPITTLTRLMVERLAEAEAKGVVSLDWRAFGQAVFSLPEYTRYRKAVADAVDSLLQRFDTLEFCSPAIIGMADVRAVDANSRKAWEEYWSAVAPDGVFNAPLNVVLQNVTTACNQALNDVWALERQRLVREFTWHPVSQYNYYYNPQEKS